MGCDIASVWDLVNTENNYREAIPISLKHLLLPYSDKTREGIVRSLAVPDTKHAWPILVAEYRKAPIGISEDGFTRRAKDGLACALAVTATDAVIEELIEIEGPYPG